MESAVSPPSSPMLQQQGISASSRVHDLARRYSAMAKQISEGCQQHLAQVPTLQDKPRGGSVGKSEGSKISELLSKYKEQTLSSPKAEVRALEMSDESLEERSDSRGFIEDQALTTTTDETDNRAEEKDGAGVQGVEHKMLHVEDESDDDVFDDAEEDASGQRFF
ncbi:hypothetical protein BGW38_001387 [Lunasporangiospora selenospora]|uniref:Uncharacterized protein n=1 Tax=Lunasporangiospora selenospora TaxID=979761 RepID=A0A9P6FUE2_9FUNG|nr:hypothetical protein BGW38_001387 [Lunasporangiospora selenospora]